MCLEATGAMPAREPREVAVERVSARAPLSGGVDAPTADPAGGAFAALLPSDAATPAAAARANGSTQAAAALGGMAWIEAGVAEALARDAQDREARRHGKAMLQALGAVQHAMLGGDDDQARSALAALANTAQDGHEADDPVLKLILREIGVRAAVALARGDLEHAGPDHAGRATGKDVSTG